MVAPLSIRSDHWQLWLDPSRGVQWQALRLRRDDGWTDICPDCRDHGDRSTTDLAAANFHMIPYSNRIRNGRFRFKGDTYQLVDSDRHAIHGALRKRPWRVTDHDDNRLRAVYDSSLDGELNWPWPLRATIDYHLDGATLHGTLAVENAGASPMPAGLGWHPYFVRHIDGASPQLTLPVSGVYPDHDGNCLPSGPSQTLPASLDFRTPTLLDPAQRIDHCFSGLAGACEIAWPAAGIRLNLHASNLCRHLVLFNPDKPYFAVEPVSNANDGVNLQRAGIDAGVITLEPGAALSADLRITATA